MVIYHGMTPPVPGCARKDSQREAAWTESLAVCDRAFVEQAAQGIRNPSRFEYASLKGDRDAWAVREGSMPCTAIANIKRNL